MPRLISEITEIATALGMLGGDSIPDRLGPLPTQLTEVDQATWARVSDAWAQRGHTGHFLAAFGNGRAFLRAVDGLRGRVPARIEWRGPHQSPGDEVVPADLRVDHVYLVSCKYLSKILVNASPTNLFDRLLAGGQGQRSDVDWFAEIAPAEHQRLYEVVTRRYGGGMELPMRARDMGSDQRSALRRVTPRDWSADCADAYSELCRVVSARSADRWRSALEPAATRRAVLWRLLRIGSAPYFVLGVGGGRSLRLRVATPWDWHRDYELRRLDVAGDGVGQPRVGWRAEVRERASGAVHEVAGHIEVRWSHGRFNQPPEAKAYLDTPLHLVPGYHVLR